jgi:hypothetical protein
MTALSLAGKGRVVTEKHATRRSMEIPFPPCLNAVYNTSIGSHIIVGLLSHALINKETFFCVCR